MRRLTVWIVSTAAGVVLLFSYHTSTSGPAGGKVVAGAAPVGVVAVSPGVDPTGTATASSGPTTPTAASPSRPAAAAPAASPAPKKTAASMRTINGAAADTRYGPVQVQIKVRGSRVLSADAIVYPQDQSRSRDISSFAVPQLDDETTQAQSAQIDAVSGASYTSDGYRQSLQSALDAAHL